MNHTLVVSEELLAGRPGLAADIYAWFSESERLGARGAGQPGGYGLTAANRASLETLLKLTREQVPGESGIGGSADDYFRPTGR
jgi:hypothetical protein